MFTLIMPTVRAYHSVLRRDEEFYHLQIALLRHDASIVSALSPSVKPSRWPASDLIS